MLLRQAGLQDVLMPSNNPVPWGFVAGAVVVAGGANVVLGGPVVVGAGVVAGGGIRVCSTRSRQPRVPRQ